MRRFLFTIKYTTTMNNTAAHKRALTKEVKDLTARVTRVNECIENGWKEYDGFEIHSYAHELNGALETAKYERTKLDTKPTDETLAELLWQQCSEDGEIVFSKANVFFQTFKVVALKRRIKIIDLARELHGQPVEVAV